MAGRGRGCEGGGGGTGGTRESGGLVLFAGAGERERSKKKNAFFSVLVSSSPTPTTQQRRLLAHLLRNSGKVLAVSSSDGLSFGPRHSNRTDGEGVPAVLLHPWTEMAICEASEIEILNDGLSFDHCQLGVVLNVSTADNDAPTGDALDGRYQTEARELLGKLKK